MDENEVNTDNASHKNDTSSLLNGLDPAGLFKQGAATESRMTALGDKVRLFEPPSLEALAAIFPQFDIIGLIGAGGMGAVYMARQRDLDRIVALKILPQEISDNPVFATQFTREAKALAKLNHPHIVTLYEFGQAQGLYYIVMEYVLGVNLCRLMQRGRLSPREALAIVPQICDALQYAHDRGIVHRDIKPENILIDQEGRVKVADFGLAKLIAGQVEHRDGTSTDTQSTRQTLMKDGRVMGTPAYMAPEQFSDPAHVDNRVDIYALGVVFYQMLTGELPDKPITAPSSKVEIDVKLDEVVLRAMEKDPERRYQQASIMKTRVEQLDSSQPKKDKSGITTLIILTIAIVGMWFIPDDFKMRFGAYRIIFMSILAAEVVSIVFKKLGYKGKWKNWVLSLVFGLPLLAAIYIIAVTPKYQPHDVLEPDTSLTSEKDQQKDLVEAIKAVLPLNSLKHWHFANPEELVNEIEIPYNITPKRWGRFVIIMKDIPILVEIFWMSNNLEAADLQKQFEAHRKEESTSLVKILSESGGAVLVRYLKMQENPVDDHNYQRAIEQLNRALRLISAYTPHTQSASANFSANENDSPLPITVIKAEPIKDYPIMDTYIGRLEPSSQTEVYPCIEGVLIQTCTPGQEVRQGDVLFMLDPTQYQISFQRAENNLMQCLEGGDEKTIEAARLDLETARLDLSYTQIVAPVSGCIRNVSGKKGQTANPGDSLPLAVISRLDPMHVKVALPAREVHTLKRNIKSGTEEFNKIQMTLSDGTVYPHAGKLISIGTMVDRATETVNVTLEFPNPDGELILGDLVETKLVEAIIPEGYLIPSSAITYLGMDYAVMVVDPANGTIQPKIVEYQNIGDDNSIITEGLSKGDQVIAEFNPKTMEANQKVKVIKELNQTNPE